MPLNRIAVLSGVATLALAGSAASAFAAPAVATSAVNVRTGAGTQYAVVDVLQTGEPVDVGQCQGSWCYITHSGPDGWVSSAYLAAGAPAPQNDEDFAPPPPSQIDPPAPPPGPGPTPIPDDDNNDPNINFGFSFGNGGFSFGIGQQPQPVAASVCFYDGTSYTGGGFCASPGESYGSLGGFNNRVSSVRVFGGATATICSDNNLFGTCQTIGSNKSQLGVLNNQTSSLEVN